MKLKTLMLMWATVYLSVINLAHSADLRQSNTTEVSRNIIQRTDIPGSDEEFRLMLVEFPPGYASPAHTHPVTGLSYIVEGVAESQYEGEDLKTLNMDDSYQYPANKKHLIFRNPSKTDVLRLLVAYKIKKDGTFMHPL